MSSRDDNNSAAGAAIVGGFLAAVIAVFLMCMAVEIGRIYATRAWGKKTTTAKVLWVALGVFALICGVGWEYVNYPPTQAGAIYFISWSFLAYVILVEACDWYERRFDPPEQLVGLPSSSEPLGISNSPRTAGSALPEATLEDVLRPPAWSYSGR